MKQAKTVRAKIKSIISIRHITRAMKMVAAAKFKKAQNRLNAISNYFTRIKEAIADMGDYLAEHKHPFVTGVSPAAKKARCFIVVTGDKGLCGSFNVNVCKEAEARIKKSRDAGYSCFIISIGQKGNDYLKKRKYDLLYSTPLHKPDPKFDDLEDAVSRVLQSYESGMAAEVYVIYTKYMSTISYKVTTEKILPIDFAAIHLKKSAVANDFLFEPGPSEVVDFLMPRFIKMQIFHSIIESSCSEQGSRMIMMGSATDKASEMINHLTLTLNRARQESITGELLDIVGGVEALKKSS